MDSALNQVTLEDAAVGLVTDLSPTDIRLVTAGPLDNPTATFADFTEASFPGYTKSVSSFAGPYLDLSGNVYIQAPSSVFLNTGTANIAVTGAIGTQGAGTLPDLKFAYQFANVAIIPATLGSLTVPNKLALPLTTYTVPEPVI